MPSRIEVAFKNGVRDALGASVLRRIKEDLLLPVESVKTIDVFTFEDQIPLGELQNLAGSVFSDPIIQEVSINKPIARNFDWIIEVGYLPGVTDNVGKTSKEATEECLRKKLRGGVFTSRQYLVKGMLTKEQAEAIASKLLANTLIERWNISDIKSWKADRGFGTRLPIVRSTHQPKVDEIVLKVSDEGLVRISKERLLALNLEEMKKIQEYFADAKTRRRRKAAGLPQHPTDVELECLGQTWSEHCKHKIFNAKIKYKENGRKEEEIESSLSRFDRRSNRRGAESTEEEINSLFKTCIRDATEKIGKKRKWLVSVFKDNAGIISFNKDTNICMKVETHNSPSALDPYGGALTGIVGVNRDVMGTGMGARPIFNTDVFCFASPFYKGKIPARLMHPKRVFEGVRKGVQDGGNKSGIPTVNGCIVFDERFLGKPLVYCGTGGIMPAKVNGKPSHEKSIAPGSLALMVGGRIGKDGIHGATFSSEELHAGSPVTAVQLGDPITQKKMLDMLLEARDAGLYTAITDNGAGGLSSSIGEMSQFSGGCEIYLDKCPLKYAGLDPWEILVSESQERMTIAVLPEKLGEFIALAASRGVEATVVGKFTGTGFFEATFGGKKVAQIGMEFLHDGVPQMQLSAEWKDRKLKEPAMKHGADLTTDLLAMLRQLDICSKEYVVRQYDHEVQGQSVVKPLTGLKNDGPSDAAVLKPLPDSWEGLVVANGICPRYSDIDTYHMAACAIDEAVRNHVAVGGSLETLAGLDNFCWCDPIKSEKNKDGDYKLAQLVRANKALYDITTEYLVPCISGKDSMKNDYDMEGVRISIPPTLLFSTVGKINDVRKAVTMDAKSAGDYVYVLGETRNELGASEYYAMKGENNASQEACCVNGRLTGANVPKVDAKSALLLYRALEKAISKELVASCHDCSDGGLGVALAETAFAGGFGMDIDLSSAPRAKDVGHDYQLLFSETPSRFVVTVSPKNAKAFEAAMKGTAFAKIGEVWEGKEFAIKGVAGKRVVMATIDRLKEEWKAALDW